MEPISEPGETSPPRALRPTAVRTALHDSGEWAIGDPDLEVEFLAMPFPVIAEIHVLDEAPVSSNAPDAMRPEELAALLATLR